jgi:hypothetical protein
MHWRRSLSKHKKSNNKPSFFTFMLSASTATEEKIKVLNVSGQTFYRQCMRWIPYDCNVELESEQIAYVIEKLKAKMKIQSIN